MYESRLLVFRLVIVAATVGLSLLAWWGATSPRPRLVRAIVIWVAALMLVAIRAPAPAIILVMTTAAAWAIVAIAWRWIEPSSAVWRFQLADLCVVLLFAATLAAILRESLLRLSLGTIVNGVVASTPLAPVIAFSHLAVAGRSRWRMALAAYLAILLAAIAMPAWQPFQMLKLLGSEVSSPGNRAFLFLFLLATFSALAWIVGEAIAGMVRARRSSTHRLPLGWMIALGLATGAGALLAARFFDEIKGAGGQITYEQVRFLAILLAAPVFTALSVGGVAWLTRPLESAPSMAHVLARSTAITAAGLLAIPAAWLYWQMLWPPVIPPLPPGKPHYDRILAIVRGLNIDPSDSSSKPTAADAAAAVDELVVLLAEPNHPTIQALEDAGKPSPTRSGMSGHEFRTLVNLLHNARVAAQKQGDYDRDCDLAIAQFHLYRMTPWGSAFVDDGQGSHFLHSLRGRDEISPACARKIIDTLERALAEREDISVTRARSMALFERQIGWPMRLELVLMGREIPAEYLSRWEATNGLVEPQFRSLQMFLAIKSFRDQHGRLPRALAEMIPEFLPALPRDPFSNGSLKYVVDGEKYRLYSLGPNGTDDGGKDDDCVIDSWDFQPSPLF
jgi:hypothetical protein